MMLFFFLVMRIVDEQIPVTTYDATKFPRNLLDHSLYEECAYMMIMVQRNCILDYY